MDEENNARFIEVQLLRARIEQLRNELFSDQPRTKPNHALVAQQQTNVEPTAREKKNAEMDVIKAKLMGKNK